MVRQTKTTKKRAVSTTSEPTEYVSVREAMEILGKNKQTIYNLIRRGKLRKYRREVGEGIGGTRTLLSRSEVEGLKGKVVLQEDSSVPSR